MDNPEIKVKEVVGCDHMRLIQNPFFSRTPNVGVIFPGMMYLVCEEEKIKMVCGPCARKSKWFLRVS